MIPRWLLLVLVVGGCEKAEDPANPPGTAPAPTAPEPPRPSPPVDGVTTIELPVAKAPPVDDDRPKLVVAIDHGGSIYLGGKKVGAVNDGALSGLEQALADVRRAGVDEVYIEVDQDLPYSAVYKVMAAIQQAGISRMKLITDRDRAPPLPTPRRPVPRPPGP